MVILTLTLGANTNRAFLSQLSCVVLLYLAPTVVAPPERNFSQGQPELQQAMDNMIGQEKFMKRELQLPSVDDKNIPHLLTDRTTQLLHEAERMITPVKDMKEKEWMEGFIHKLQLLTSVLQQGTANQSSEGAVNNSTVQEFAQSLNSSTVPEGHPLQQNSSDLISKTVLESGPKLSQSDQMTSKSSVTLPETNQVKPVGDYTVDHLVVTKPGLSPAEEVEEEDELVRELESLHKISSVEPNQQHVEAPETSSPSIEVSTSVSVKDENSEGEEQVADEKEKVKERLASEVAELKRLGGSEQEIIGALHIDNLKFIDGAKVHSGEEKEVNKLDEGHESVKRVLNEKDDGVPTKVDPKYWNLAALHAAEPPQQIYMNNTFLGMHINLPPMNPRVLRKQFHYGMHRNAMVRNVPYYHAGVRDTIQKIQAQNHQNFLLRNHMYGAPNAFQPERPNGFGPIGMNPGVIVESDNRYPGVSAQPNNRYPPDNPALNHYPLNGKTIYMPYPLSQNSEYMNDITGENQMKVTTSSPDNSPTEFSDEMKRQLRDGKVILLSDNVVRSNFTSEENDQTGKSD